MNCGDGTGGRSLRADPDHRLIYTPMTMRMRRVLRRLFISVTTKDMAALVGMSPPAISRTCKDHPSISRQTKEKIRQTTVRLGYEPNFQTSSLAIQNSHTVGIILPPSGWETYQSPFYLKVIREINQCCSQKQYINTVITGQNEDEILQTIKAMTRTDLAEGSIVLYSRGQDPVLDYLYEEGLLYVLIEKACRNVNQTIYVDNDNVLAGREAARCLLNLGHARVTCLSGDHSLLYNHDRKIRCMLALAERGIPFDDQLCVEVPSVPEEQDRALTALFTREDRPTAVLVSDDILAVILERTYVGLGLSILGDMSILSFNNSLLIRLTFPPLTSVDMNVCQLGIEATARVVSHVENSELVATEIIVPHHMVEWESCAGARGFCGG